MACERTRRASLLSVALVALAVALWPPTAASASDRDELASAGVLTRGSGYGTATGSDAVRILQRRLRRLGTPPGPIDGLYGPLTEGAVERFQQRHGLAVDGIVGRQTKQRLLTPVARPTATPARPETHPDRLERKSPAPHGGAESAEPQQVRPAPTGVASRDGPAPAPDVPAELLALVGGLSLLLLGALWWKRRHQLEASVNVGLACAALLGVFGIGAAAGAIFASQAAPGDGASAQSGVLFARAEHATQSRGSARASTRTAHAARPAETAPQAPAETAPRASVATPPPAQVAAPTPQPGGSTDQLAARRAASKRPPTSVYVVKPGDSLSRIARSKLGADSSAVHVARVVEKLTDLNIATRIRSGDPNALAAGEELKLP
jgi:peptidoglycan hydrolase-like protein with peptidoglycan-binding domain